MEVHSTVEDSSKTADKAESAPACAGRQSSSGLRLVEMRQAEKGRQETTPSCHLRHVTSLVGDGSGATNIVGEADNNQHHLSTASRNHGSPTAVIIGESLFTFGNKNKYN
ncbi:hypothetical protein J6590_071530 [Homalodisca vitripennis]|nr:hypothetical protein J6590_071530 [Homalodisca vitripennis]